MLLRRSRRRRPPPAPAGSSGGGGGGADGDGGGGVLALGAGWEGSGPYVTAGRGRCDVTADGSGAGWWADLRPVGSHEAGTRAFVKLRMFAVVS